MNHTASDKLIDMIRPVNMELNDRVSMTACISYNTRKEPTSFIPLWVIPYCVDLGMEELL